MKLKGTYHTLVKLVAIIFILPLGLYSQSAEQLVSKNSMLYKIAANDSIVVYQCHVEEAIQQLTTQSGQKLEGNPQKYSITEKYVIQKTENGYTLNYFTATLTVFPNRKFSGLKIREKSYWEFKFISTSALEENALNVFLALERKGREAIEYDYAIDKYTTNQVIFKQRKNFKQLVIDGNFIISQLIPLPE